MEKRLKFGSVDWQRQKMEVITKKLIKGVELTDEEQVFISVQAWHNKRGVENG